MGSTLSRYLPAGTQDYWYGDMLHSSAAEYTTEVSIAETMRRCKEYTPPAPTSAATKFASWAADHDTITVASFNLLAPCYKRLAGQRNSMGRTLRESHSPDAWQKRADDTLAFLKSHLLGTGAGAGAGAVVADAEAVPALGGHSIIALQEFWLEPAYRQQFQAAFVEAGYTVHTLRRGEKKRDSVGVLYRTEEFDLCASREVHLVADDRVALLLHLHHKPSGRAVVVVSTHLTFPHSLFDRQLQMKQVSALAAALASFSEQQRLGDACLSIVAGDFNVEGRSPVCQFLRSQGYVAAFDVGGPVNNSAAAVGGGPDWVSPDWVSHRTHLDQELGVDHIFVRRPGLSSQGPAPSQGSSALSSPDHVYVGANAVVPADQACGKWDATFTISDHRPVSTTLHLSRRSSGVDTEAKAKAQG